MRRILSKKNLRQLKLIECLYFTKKLEVPERFLLKKLDVTERMLKDDVNQINEQFDFITIAKNEEYYTIDFSKDSTIDKVYENYLQNSNDFKLLVYLFLNDDVSSGDLEEELFLSASTIYRIVNDLQDALESEYGFTISTNPFKLVGDEGHIRYFFQKYYTEAYGIFDWPFDQVDINQITDMCLFFYDVLDISTDIYSLRKFALDATINYIRNNNGHSLGETNEKVSAIFATFSETKLESFNEEFGFELTLDFMNNFSSIFSENDYSFSYNHLLEHIEEDSHDRAAYNMLVDFIDNFSEKYNVPLSNKEDLILELFNMVSIEHRAINKTYLLYPRYQAFEMNVSKEFPLIHDEIKENLNDFLLLMLGEYPEELLCVVIYTFYLQWEGLFIYLEKIFDPIKTLVLSDFDQRHAQALKDMLNREYPNLLDIDVWENKTISIDMLENSEYDLIITGFSLSQIEGKYCYSLNNLPSDKDLLNIAKLIEQIRSKNFDFND